jgi:hypothetical protein
VLYILRTRTVEPPNDERSRGERIRPRAGSRGVPHLYVARAKQEEMHAQTRMPPSPLPLSTSTTGTNPSPPHATEAHCYGSTVLLVHLDAARTVSPGAACLPPCPPIWAPAAVAACLSLSSYGTVLTLSFSL